MDIEKLWYYLLVGWIVTINHVFLELIEKMENWGEDWIWYVKIYSTRWINCQNLFHFLRISTFNESLPSGEVNNFSRYTVESPAQSLGIIWQISLSLRRLFCWKRECSLPYKISVFQLQVLVLCFTTVMFWLLKRVCIFLTPLEFKSI